MTIKNSPLYIQFFAAKPSPLLPQYFPKIFLHASDKNPLKSLREPQSNRLLSGMQRMFPPPGHFAFSCEKANYGTVIQHFRYQFCYARSNAVFIKTVKRFKKVDDRSDNLFKILFSYEVFISLTRRKTGFKSTLS